MSYQNTVYNAASTPKMITEPKTKAGETPKRDLSISIV